MNLVRAASLFAAILAVIVTVASPHAQAQKTLRVATLQGAAVIVGLAPLKRYGGE